MGARLLKYLVHMLPSECKVLWGEPCSVACCQSVEGVACCQSVEGVAALLALALSLAVACW